MSLTGNVGRVAILEKKFLPAALNQRVACLRLKSKAISKKYLYHILNSNHFEFKCINASNGVAQKNMSTEWLKLYEIPLYDQEKQEEIVKVLDTVNTIISKRKFELQKLDDLIKARFVEIFGETNLSLCKKEWVLISNIGTVVSGSTPKTNISDYWDGEFRWITPAELSNDSGVIYDSIKKITKAGIKSCSLQELPIGTVILSSRAPIGKVAIAGNTFYCNQGFKCIICSNKIIPRYLYYLLLLNEKYLVSLGRGATFKEISKSIVENIKIPCPTIDKQLKFTEFANQIDKSKFVIKKALDKTQLLFDSLMQQYFE